MPELQRQSSERSVGRCPPERVGGPEKPLNMALKDGWIAESMRARHIPFTRSMSCDRRLKTVHRRMFPCRTWACPLSYWTR